MALADQLGRILRIGLFQFDLDKETLFDEDGAPVYLRRQSTLVLALLARRAGETVSKDRIVQEVWKDLNVTDDSVVQCVADIRRALNDKRRTLLQTIPKRGYLLMVENTSTVMPIPETGIEAGRAYLHIRFVRRLGGVEAPELQRWLTDLSTRKVLRASSEGALLAFDKLQHALSCAQSMRQGSDGAAAPQMGLTVQPPVNYVRTPARADENAVRLSEIAQPGDILASVDVRDTLVDGLDCRFEDLGDIFLPRTEQSTRVYAVRPPDGAAVLSPQIHQGDLLPTVAVVPFQLRSQNEDADVIGELLADDLISALARSSEVYVTSRLSTSRFRTRGSSLREIGEYLRANFVLTGRYSAVGERIELDLQLAEVESSRVLWTNQIGFDLAEAGSVAQDIVAQVRRIIVMREVERARVATSPQLENSTLLMAAIGLMHRFSTRDFNRAKTLLDTLIGRIPDAPVPLAWMARWHVLRVQQGWSENPLDEARLALACTKRALDIDPGNVTALVSEGFVLTNLKSRLDEALTNYDAALESNPNDPLGRLLRGTLYAFKGDGQRATQDTERALHLTPLDPHRFFFLSLAGSACIAAEDYHRSLELADISLKANRTHTSTLRVKAVAQFHLGRGEEARATAAQLLELQPGLTVGRWLSSSPSREYPIGQLFAYALRNIGIPE